MSKKLITACMALVAFAAFVLPASASAANTPLLNDSEGVVKVGSLIDATNVGNAIFWNTAKTIEQVVCSKATLTGKVLKNTTGEVEGEITKAEYSGSGANLDERPECTGSFGSSSITVRNLPLIIKSNNTMAEDEFQVTGAGGAKVKFLITSTTAGECEYESTNAAIVGTFTTGESETKDSTFSVTATAAGSGATLIKGGFLCPSSGLLQQTFTMETDGTTKAIWVTK